MISNPYSGRMISYKDAKGIARKLRKEDYERGESWEHTLIRAVQYYESALQKTKRRCLICAAIGKTPLSSALTGYIHEEPK